MWANLMMYKITRFNCAARKLHKSLISTMNSANSKNWKEYKIEVPYGFIAAKILNESGKKTPILAMHGWMDNAGTWDTLCPLLDEGHPIFAFDAPGHGLSSQPPIGLGTYTTDHLVTIHRILQHLEWKQVILLGHSMGGGASMLYAATMPENVQKLIMIDLLKPINIEAEDQPDRTAISLQSLLQAEEKLLSEPPRYSYEEIVEKLVKSYGLSLTPEAAKILLKRGARCHDDGKYSFTHSPILRAASTLSMTLAQQEAFASRIRCDFLLIKASDSPKYVTKGNWMRFLETYKQHSRRFVLEVVEGRHHVHLTDPEPVARIVNTFLRDLPQQELDHSRAEEYMKALL